MTLLVVLFVVAGLIGRKWHWKGAIQERPMNWVTKTGCKFRRVANRLVLYAFLLSPGFCGHRA
jgi:hypothetical protein